MNKFDKDFGITSGTNTFGGYNTFDSDNDRYPDLLAAVKERFGVVIASGRPLFTTSAANLYQAYLDQFPARVKQHYVCRSCQQFIERFGGLAFTDDKGNVKSAVWDENIVPPFFRKNVRVLQHFVETSRITGVFKADENVLGTPKTGAWTHLSVDFNQPGAKQKYVNQSRIQSAHQWMAEKKEDYNTLNNAIAKFDFDTVETAAHIIKNGNLYRVEKVKGVSDWFYSLLTTLKSTRGYQSKANLIWKAVAEAPTGFTHIPGSSYGQLLTWVQEGKSMTTIATLFREMLDPLHYQRAQTAPKAGNIARAEKIVQTLKSEGALQRRFARTDEVKKLWTPRAKTTAPRQGVFDHLYQTEPKKTTLNIPAQLITWDKFSKTVLPEALEIEYLVKTGKDNYAAIVTAANSYAPPILQWDTVEERNPYSWYVYGKGSLHSNWNLNVGYVKVKGITYQPSMWTGYYPHQGQSVILLLDGAKDLRYRGAGNALFPEILKTEYREIRHTIDNYSKGETLTGGTYGDLACGIRLQGGSAWDTTVRVTTALGTTVYKLDRWD